MGGTQEDKIKFKLTISTDDTMSYKVMELPVPSEENKESNSTVTWVNFSLKAPVQENPNEEEINPIYRLSYGYITAKEQ